MSLHSDLFRQRLQTQHVTGTPLARPEDVVRLLGAVQSQDHAGAKWSVGQRIKRGTDAMVEDAFATGRILRTHVLRPTWHYVTPTDIRWLLQLTSPHVHRLNGPYYRKYGLTGAVLARCHTVLGRALEGGKQLMREELADLLADAGIVAKRERLAYIMMHAELDGLICSGAMRGKQHTYALLEERAPGARTFAREEGLAELALRFFTGHAPATLKHFVWWSGLSVADAKAGLAQVQYQLESTVVDGNTFWSGVPNAAPRRIGPVAHLLPEYDEALVGTKDMEVGELPRARPRWKDAFLRPVLIDGQRAGTWRRTVGRDSVVVETNLFASLNPGQRKLLRAAADRYGRFLGLPATLA